MNRKVKTTAAMLIAAITITGCQGLDNVLRGIPYDWTPSIGAACNQNYNERRPLYTSLSVYRGRLERDPNNIQAYEDLEDTRAALRHLERQATAIHPRCGPDIEDRCCEDKNDSPASGKTL